MIRLGLQLVSVYALYQTSWTGIFQGGEFGNGDIQKTLRKVVFSIFNCVNSFKKRR